MPDRPGVALVVIQHLDPTKKSLAPELLARSTSMPVCQVEDDPQVKPDRVYVIPPGKYLSISNGKLHLSEPDKPRSARMAIDVFLRSLAADQAARAVGVILSGSGTDGTLGVKAIKAAGGIVIAQDPLTAEFDAMPRGAIQTGTVDHILPAEEISEVLVRYAQHPYVREEPTASASARADETAALQPDGLNAILALLRTHTRRDFRPFKEKMVVRRTRRRMCLYHLDDYDVYLKYLRENPDEVEALARDLLISVTDFFRDPDAWEALQRLAVRPIVEAKSDGVPIRVWTAGCATGEEPYSLAMLFLEEMRRTEKSCPLQVFASDIDRAALEYARGGRYPRSIEGDVAPERLNRFFTPEVADDYYRVNKLLRETVLFAEQDVIGDPPFSKLDLICCRNLLIYLKPDVQEQIIGLFHFALNEGGVLFLGTAETIGRQADLFHTLDKRWRIFRRLGATRREHLEIPQTAFGARREAEPARTEPRRRESRLAHLAQERLLQLLAPNAVLVDRQWRIHYISGNVDPFLTHKPGVPSDNLLENARLGLRTKLRSAVHSAFTEKKSVSLPARMQRAPDAVPVTLTVHIVPDREHRENLALVIFEEAAADRSAAGPQPEEVKRDTPATPATSGTGAAESLKRERTEHVDFDADAVVHQLEEELSHARYDLQASIEQLETSNEEFRAANEEVMSINEELQSTNEELETSKEELQSLNEELLTVNTQLSVKLDELESKHADLENLIAATDVATICLDPELAIRWFTPAAQRVIRLKPTDNGRPLSHLADDFTDSDLAPVAERVLKSLTPAEDEVSCRDGRTLLRRITPYRTENRIGGVVITFVDISSRRASEQSLRESQERIQAILNAAADAIITINHSGVITSVNAATERMFGYRQSELVGENVKILMPPPYCDEHDEYVARYLRTGEARIIGTGRELAGRRKDGTIFPIDLAVSAVDHLHLFTGIIRDISERKSLEEQLLHIAEAEQHRIGEDLHDDVGQELAGLALTIDTLTESLDAARSADADLSRRIGRRMSMVSRKVRFLSHGLVPVEVDASGLMAALEALAVSVSELAGPACRFECPEPILVDDNRAATQLYRIAQEAVTNAVRHGNATTIEIALERAESGLVLTIQDDGAGISDEAIHGGGMGLRIMQHRAGLLNARLTVAQASGGGTLVCCTAPLRPRSSPDNPQPSPHDLDTSEVTRTSRDWTDRETTGSERQA